MVVVSASASRLGGVSRGSGVSTRNSVGGSGGISTAAEKANLERLRKFQRGNKLNKRCADCLETGTTYICLDFKTFICTTCSGLHREFNHKVKGVSVTKWSADEVADIENNGGNERAREKYMKEWTAEEFPEPDPAQPSKIREFIRKKYVEKLWMEKPKSQASNADASSKGRLQKEKKSSAGASQKQSEDVLQSDKSHRDRHRHHTDEKNEKSKQSRSSSSEKEKKKEKAAKQETKKKVNDKDESSKSKKKEKEKEKEKKSKKHSKQNSSGSDGSENNDDDFFPDKSKSSKGKQSANTDDSFDFDADFTSAPPAFVSSNFVPFSSTPSSSSSSTTAFSSSSSGWPPIGAGTPPPAVSNLLFPTSTVTPNNNNVSCFLSSSSSPSLLPPFPPPVSSMFGSSSNPSFFSPSSSSYAVPPPLSVASPSAAVSASSAFPPPLASSDLPNELFGVFSSAPVSSSNASSENKATQRYVGDPFAEIDGGLTPSPPKISLNNPFATSGNQQGTPTVAASSPVCGVKGGGGLGIGGKGGGGILGNINTQTCSMTSANISPSPSLPSMYGSSVPSSTPSGFMKNAQNEQTAFQQQQQQQYVMQQMMAAQAGNNTGLQLSQQQPGFSSSPNMANNANTLNNSNNQCMYTPNPFNSNSNVTMPCNGMGGGGFFPVYNNNNNNNNVCSNNMNMSNNNSNSYNTNDLSAVFDNSAWNANHFNMNNAQPINNNNAPFAELVAEFNKMNVNASPSTSTKSSATPTNNSLFNDNFAKSYNQGSVGGNPFDLFQ